MKAAFRDIPLKPIYAAYAGNTPIKSVWKGDEKIWPDNLRRVTRLWLDIASLTGLQRIYWNHALAHIGAGASSSRFIRLTASHNYNINRTYGNFALATHEGNGCISFPAGTGPLASEIVAGKKVKMRMVMPKTTSSRVEGNGEFNGREHMVSGVYPNILPDTEVRTFYSKGKKKVSSGTEVYVTGIPSGYVLMAKQVITHGYGQSDRDVSFGTILPFSTDDSVKLDCVPRNSRTYYSAYFVYPAFDTIITPTILRTETTTIES